MAARAKKLTALAAALCFACSVGLTGSSREPQTAAPHRIVSLVPALTEMLFAIGAGSEVVGVGSYDEFPPEVKKLPRVGALINPDTERIFALRPDLVITYGSQAELEAQFSKVGIRTFSYRHGGIATVLASIRDLGRAASHPDEAERVARELETRLAAIRARVQGRPRPRTLLVFERQPKTLRDVYASGGEGFLHEILDAAGGANVFADVKRESVQPSQETLLARSPDVIIEIRAVGLLEASEARDARSVWAALGSVPAVRSGQIHLLTGEYLVVPGPRLAQATEALARVLHPEVFR
jgi:iron complex transport system substrate-binding protein